ncbi:hypothetical protein HNQ88_001619 [Aureibacter tunicatorum]|uniref:Uncharacterized protein n=1 Tax=Aureibacter tunicatorum TaxID=866807 RepID=A0AAE3XLD5_9BACT|nr:hypothetical protein [Aureibacter tunicatorum]BDD05487.1 hypothetical protein AUTU_29700 [Aureibacter tunicatorum]
MLEYSCLEFVFMSLAIKLELKNMKRLKKQALKRNRIVSLHFFDNRMQGCGRSTGANIQ